MTELFDKAAAIVGRMPPADQDYIAEVMLRLAGMCEPEEIEPEHRDAVFEGMVQAARGEFATDEEVAAAFRHFRK